MGRTISSTLLLVCPRLAQRFATMRLEPLPFLDFLRSFGKLPRCCLVHRKYFSFFGLQLELHMHALVLFHFFEFARRWSCESQRFPVSLKGTWIQGYLLFSFGHLIIVFGHFCSANRKK